MKVEFTVITALDYVGIVVAFESLTGILQPGAGATLVITTTGGDGAASPKETS